jgi:hypothetical protein
MAAEAEGAKCAASSIPNSKHHDADPNPDPSFHFDADQDQDRLFTLIGIRIRVLVRIKVMKICDHRSTDHSRPQCARPRPQCGRPWPNTLTLSVDPDLAFDFDADPDPLPKLMRIYRFLRIRIRIRNSQSVLTFLSFLLVFSPKYVYSRRSLRMGERGQWTLYPPAILLRSTDSSN